MKKFERLAEATAPDGTTLALYRHDGAFYIRVNGVELMSTRRHNSEDALADVVCTRLAGRSDARVLIGGLGLGFTLAAALRSLSAGAHVVVAELLPEVIAWNREPSFGLSVEALADPRVELRQADVAEVLAEADGLYDGIMLDVDNGTGALTTTANARLYERSGIAAAVRALRPGGRVAYWSADPDPAFETALRAQGLAVEVKSVRAHATSGGRHVLFVARKAGAQ